MSRIFEAIKSRKEEEEALPCHCGKKRGRKCAFCGLKRELGDLVLDFDEEIDFEQIGEKCMSETDGDNSEGELNENNTPNIIPQSKRDRQSQVFRARTKKMAYPSIPERKLKSAIKQRNFRRKLREKIKERKAEQAKVDQILKVWKEDRKQH
ncbi:unnamed protein product [Moneuplotes crassus]|uniref:Uncharacterized protein n=1 Tax=Euplotes crassus TaxID=5936 RepID=A0AAD1XNP0_EUPCR|nr:unnamed protein product [Moneuplotes crassus]